MIRYLYLMAFLLSSFLVKSQAIVADFSADTQQGCAPLLVNFKDMSSGDPKFWNWDFGNGQLSSLQNPTIYYGSPGKYTVKLVVRNANGTDGITKTGYITVSQSPVADFISDYNNVCLPANIQFRDRSAPNGGTLTKWEWDFGDGTNSVLQEPAKAYTATGFYNISLKVTSSTGCTSTNIKSRFIRVLSGVEADFRDSVTKVCLPPYNASFTNETSGPGNISYTWDFGNGNTSKLKNPGITFASTGTYNIQLIAISDLGCSDTMKKTLVVKGANTSFSMPDSACKNSLVTFTNNSAPTPVSSVWNFGDGSSSSLINPTKTYTVSGKYNVVLFNKYAECSDSITKTINILSPPKVDFTSNTQGACKAPLSVVFQDTSPDAVSWLWNFGDGGTSNQQAPTHVYANTGEFNVTLTIQSKAGCSNSITKNKWIRILAPAVSISNAPAGGCIPFTFNPAVGINSVDAVTGYLWDFGDGSPVSGLANPSHTYASQGSYTLKLTITTAGGCTASVTIPNGVRTGTRPSVNFSANKDSVCVLGAVNFTDLSTAVPGPVDGWLWNFGDGRDTAIKNPAHAYSDTGTFTVRLIAYSNGCADSISKPAFVHVLPPIANFYDSTDCTNQLRAFFINKSVTNAALGPITYLWEFGDPAKTTSSSPQPNFTYPALGTYTVKLTVTNGALCSNTYIKQVTLFKEVADFTVSKTTVCKNERFTISAITSIPANISVYVWSINGGTQFVAPRSFDTSLAAVGSYSIALNIFAGNGCTDTKTKPAAISVTGPTAGFVSSLNNNCQNAIATFTDKSTPANNIVKWTFSYGDGVTQSFTSPPFTHPYKDTGNFTVRLTVQDNAGCSDIFTLPQPILITRPRVAFQAKQTAFCPGIPLQFTDSSQSVGTSTFLWNFGDGTTSTLQNPVHIYGSSDKVYNVTLKVQDSLGCSDSLTKISYISVKAPKSAFTIVDSTTICPPLETKFFFAGKDYESFYWDFGDSSNVITQLNPKNFYNTYGTFTAKLFLVGAGGCIDSSQHTIQVFNPDNSVISYSPLNACNELLVDFTIKHPPDTKYTFYFGDGASLAAKKDSIRYFYNSPNTYYPYIDLQDSLGCHVAIGGPDAIIVLGANPFFSVDHKSFCDSGTVYFTNYTIGNDPIVSSIWNFGDGATSTDNDAIHRYTIPGRYIASLNVKTLNGCSKSLTDTIRVYATPDPNIDGDSIVCINSPLSLTGTLEQPDSSVTWNWNFGNGQASTKQTTSVIYDKEGNYTISLEVTNMLGCKTTVTKNIVVKPLPVITVQTNAVIAVGTGITLPITYSQNVMTYSWTPISGLSCINCATPIANPKNTITYTVSVTDSFGCISSKDILVTVVCNEKNYFVPNTFTPNADGVNDIFYPRGNNINRIQSMRIFSRWGEMIFEKRNFAANNPTDGWDGTYKGKIAGSDAYVYIIEFICENGSIIPFKGNVTLIR